MREDSIAKINLAVDTILDKCAGAVSPFSELRELVNQLDRSEWLPEEIKAIEQAAFRALTSMN